MASSSSAPVPATTLLGACDRLGRGRWRGTCASSTSTDAGRSSARRRTLNCADLPPEVLGQRILAHPELDTASRLAAFRTGHALARMVLVHTPSSKTLARDCFNGSSEAWPPALVQLCTRWHQALPQPLNLRLGLLGRPPQQGGMPPSLPPAAPTPISQHVHHLHLHGHFLSIFATLASWRLHDTSLWPHLQHLTITGADWLGYGYISGNNGGGTQQLQPIPGLQSLKIKQSERDLYHEAVDRLLQLVSNARRAHLDLPYSDDISYAKIMAHLQRLTHVHVPKPGNQTIQALLRLPALEHVVVESLVGARTNVRQQPCRWKSLTVLGTGRNHEMLHNFIAHLGCLPLQSLERLTIHDKLVSLNLGDGEQEHQDCAAGLALLQRLHSEGKLVLRPSFQEEGLRRWRLPEGAGFFEIACDGDKMAALMRLVVEAGQGISAVYLDLLRATLPQLRQTVEPLGQQQGCTVRTLCMDAHTCGHTWTRMQGPAACSPVLLGMLPSCIEEVRVPMLGYADESLTNLRALVRGGAASLQRPLKLTVLRGYVDAAMEAELRELAQGAGGGREQPLLTVEFVDGRYLWM